MPRPRVDVLTLAIGVAATAWIVVSLWPAGGYAAWPAVSLGALACAGATVRGHPVLRGVGSFAGACAMVVGGAQIAALWLIGGWS